MVYKIVKGRDKKGQRKIVYIKLLVAFFLTKIYSGKMASYCVPIKNVCMHIQRLITIKLISFY